MLFGQNGRESFGHVLHLQDILRGDRKAPSDGEECIENLVCNACIFHHEGREIILRKVVRLAQDYCGLEGWTGCYLNTQFKNKAPGEEFLTSPGGRSLECLLSYTLHHGL